MSTYSLTLRSEVNRRLYISEMDNNFLYLQQLALSGTTSQVTSYEEDTYVNWMTKIDNGELQTGSFIKITDVYEGLTTLCTGTNSLSTEGICGFLNADYQNVGDYSAVEGFQVGTNSNQGVWNTDLENRILNYTTQGISKVILVDPSSSYFSPGDEVYIVDSLDTVINNVDILNVVDAYHITCSISADIVAPTGGKYLKNITNPASIAINGVHYAGATFSIGDTLYSDNNNEFMITAVGGNLVVYTTLKGGTFSEMTFLHDDNGTYVNFENIGDTQLLDNDIVIWDNNHYQVVDTDMFNGQGPIDNPQAYMLLETEGYILEWDQVTFTYFDGFDVIYRKDKRNNYVRFINNNFQWGDDKITNCKIEGNADIINNRGFINISASSWTGLTIDNNTGSITGNLSGSESGFDIINNNGTISFDITGLYCGFHLEDNNYADVRIQIDGNNSGATIVGNDSEINLFINGNNDDVNIYNNSGRIDAHVHGYNSGLYSEAQTGDVKVYIYDESYVNTSFNAADIYANYINGSYVIHTYNSGDIYSTTFDGFGRFTSDNYFDNTAPNQHISLEVFCSINNNIYYTPAGHLYTSLQNQGRLIPGMTYEIIDNEGPATTYGLDNSDFYNEDNTDNYVRVIARTETDFERFGKRSWKVPTNAPVWNQKIAFEYSTFDGDVNQVGFNNVYDNSNILYNYYIGTSSTTLTIRYEGTYYDFNPYLNGHGSKYTTYDNPNLIYEYIYDFQNSTLDINIESNPYRGLLNQVSGVVNGLTSSFINGFYGYDTTSTRIDLLTGSVTTLTYSGLTDKNTLTLGASYSNGLTNDAIQLSTEFIPVGSSPSTYRFLEGTYSSIFIGTNGYLTFGDSKTSHITADILTGDLNYDIPGVYISTYGKDCKGAIVEWGGWIWLNYGGDWGSQIGDSTSLDTDYWLKINKTYQSGIEQEVIHDITGFYWSNIVSFYYRNEVSEVIYKNGIIEWLRDSKGNEVDFILLQDNAILNNTGCFYPELMSVDFGQFGRSFGIYGNKNQFILNNYVDGSDTHWFGSYPSNITIEGTQIYGNIGQFGMINGNVLVNGAQISSNVIYPFANIGDNYLDGAPIRLNTIESNSFITANYITQPIMSNHLFNGVEIPGGPYEVTAIVNCSGGFNIINCTLDKANLYQLTGQLRDNLIELSNLDSLKGDLTYCSISGLDIVFSDNDTRAIDGWSGAVYTPQSSTFDAVISVTSSTLYLQDYNYAGIISLTCSNPTASISYIQHDYSGSFEFKIEPQYGLAVTFEGTPVANLTSETQILLPSDFIEIDGNTVDYIKFQPIQNQQVYAVRQTDAMNYN